MTTKVSGTIYENGSPEEILVILNSESRVFPLGPKSSLKLTDRKKGFYWEKVSGQVNVNLDGKKIGGRRSNAIGAEHTMTAKVPEHGELVASWTPGLPQRAKR